MKASMANPQAPEMVVIAEVCCSPREVRKILMVQAEKLIGSMHPLWERNRAWLVAELYKFLDRHHFSDFQRKKTVEAVAKRAWSRYVWANYRKRFD